MSESEVNGDDLLWPLLRAGLADSGSKEVPFNIDCEPTVSKVLLILATPKIGGLGSLPRVIFKKESE